MQERSRKVAPKAKSISFMPPRAVTQIEISSIDAVSESIAFWIGRLRALACPQCAVVGSLETCRLNYGIAVRCGRTEFDACDYEREILFGAV